MYLCRVLTVEGVNGGTCKFATFPSPTLVMHGVFEETGGLPDVEAIALQLKLAPTPSVLMASDALAQITTYEECMAVSKYFRRCALWIREMNAIDEE
jgi:hypothetical protein